MSKEVAVPTQSSIHELALIENDLSKLQPEERLSLYNRTCDSLGLNPLTQPFAYLKMNGKVSLYAKKDCTDQLRKIHSVSVEIVSKEKVNDIYIVTAKATDKSGRVDEDMGTVNIKNLSGEMLGNAMLKAITKAKRRVTLSICGLGILDETEVETIENAERIVTPKNDIMAPVDQPEPQPKTLISPPEQKQTNNVERQHVETFPSPEEKPIINFTPVGRTSVNDYQLQFSMLKWKRGTTFKEMGKAGAKELLTTMQAHVLKLESNNQEVHPTIIEFCCLAKEFLLRD